jgi:membrane protease YdiL (CAAX protease family)
MDLKAMRSPAHVIAAVLALAPYLAAVAGIFYGRAWRRDRRVGAAAVTHASVDAIWSLWLR